MLKVLYLPLGDQPGMNKAWNAAGVRLEIYDFHGVWEKTKNKQIVAKQFLDKVRDFQPNLIHMQLQFTGLLDVDVINEARKICPGVKITNWSGDVRDKAIPDFIKVSSALDYSLISSTGQLDLYKRAGCNNIMYWQIGYDPEVIYPMNCDTFDYDVSFIANNYGTIFPDGRLRNSVAVSLIKDFGDRAGIFGSGYKPHRPSVSIIKGNEVYNKSLCTLSISNFNNISHYFSDRLLYCVASGRPTISWYFPGFESYFVEGSEIFIARNYDDVRSIVNRCKADPAMAKQVGINGQKRVLKEHTFTSRVIELLHMTNLIHLV